MNRAYGLISILFVILIIVAIGSVFVVNKTPNNSFPQVGIGGGPGSVSPSTSAEAIKNRASLTKILEEHVTMGVIHLQNLYDGKDTSSSKAMMDKNTNDLLNLAGKYTTDKAILASFKDSWNKHMMLYEQYTLALKAKDPLKADQVKMALHSVAGDFGNTASEIFPDVSANSATDAFIEHIDLTLSIMNAYSKKDETAKISQATKSSLQAAHFAEVLIP